MKIKPYYNYLKYVLEHKKNVFKTCWKRKLYLHAITHDLSKFSPKEFIPYAEWFYGYHGVKLEKEFTYEQLNNQSLYKMSCISRNYLECKRNFNKAWEHHYKNNPHHWDYWLDAKGIPQRMDSKYLNQMIADWEAMSLKFGGFAQEYYLRNYNNIKLEYNTRLLLEMMLKINDSLANNYGHTLEEFVIMYDENEYNRYFGFIKDVYGVDSYGLLKKGVEIK